MHIGSLASIVVKSTHNECETKTYWAVKSDRKDGQDRTFQAFEYEWWNVQYRVTQRANWIQKHMCKPFSYQRGFRLVRLGELKIEIQAAGWTKPKRRISLYRISLPSKNNIWILFFHGQTRYLLWFEVHCPELLSSTQANMFLLSIFRPQHGYTNRFAKQRISISQNPSTVLFRKNAWWTTY